MSGKTVTCLGLLFFTCTIAAQADPCKKDFVLYHHDARYSAFPSLYKSPHSDELWVSFGWNTTRSHYGKAAGGETGHISLYSPDGGATWLEKSKDPYYKEPPDERSYLVLRDGTAISVGPLMHEVLPAERKQEMVKRGILVKDWPGGNISASYRVRMSRKRPGEQKAQSSFLELPFFASMGGFGFGVVLPGDIVLKPVYGLASGEDPAYRAWVLRSEDKGDTWQLVTQAYDQEHAFGETDVLALPDGRVLAMMRAEGGKTSAPLYDRGFLWQTESHDAGKSWSPPRMTNMWGYPPTLLLLKNGDVLCSYGYRRRPYGVRACFSKDGGRTWDAANEAILRFDALASRGSSVRANPGDLGYPRSVEMSDGSIFTVYYITLGDGVTHIAATRWSPDYRGPAGLRRGAAAIPNPKPDPSLAPECILGEVGARKFDFAMMQTFIPTADTISMIAIRVAKDSADPRLTHTHGMHVAVRRPEADRWFTKAMASSRMLKPEEVNIGGWNAFVFDPPVHVKPGDLYAFTVYNSDWLGATDTLPTRLRPGLTGDRSWFLNTNAGQTLDYPNGSVSPDETDDLAFKVYAQPGPLPSDPR